MNGCDKAVSVGAIIRQCQRKPTVFRADSGLVALGFSTELIVSNGDAPRRFAAGLIPCAQQRQATQNQRPPWLAVPDLAWRIESERRMRRRDGQKARWPLTAIRPFVLGAAVAVLATSTAQSQDKGRPASEELTALEASRLHTADHRRSHTRRAVERPRQEGAAHSVRLVVSGLSTARASLARSDSRVGEATTPGTLGRHPGATRRPLWALCPVEAVRLADPPRPDQSSGGAGRPDHRGDRRTRHRRWGHRWGHRWGQSMGSDPSMGSVDGVSRWGQIRRWGPVPQPIMPLDLPVKVQPWELTVYPCSHIRRWLGVTRPAKARM
jgi:hypothetical protein